MNEHNVLSSYAAYSINENERLNSSSGGIFSLLAKQILLCNGSVYGVAMTTDCMSAEFIRITDTKQLAKLQGSKYFQAHMGKTYQAIKNDLNNGRKVLFSGTGCQINGLKKFIDINTSDISSNLYCIDVICHGAPSPALWQIYAKYMEKTNNGKLIRINFRCKNNGSNNCSMLKTNEYQIYESKDTNPFMIMFLRDYCLRPSCYKCIAKQHKLSDLTIADFWGIDNILPEMNDNKGTSLVLLRTQKGQELFDSVKDELKCKPVSYLDGVKENPSEYKSVVRPKERDFFFEDMQKLTLPSLQVKYATPAPISFSRKTKNLIKKTLRKLNKNTWLKNRTTCMSDYGLLFTFQKTNKIHNYHIHTNIIHRNGEET